MNEKVATEEEEMEDEMEQSVTSSAGVSSHVNGQRKRCRANHYYGQEPEDQQDVAERRDELA